MNSNRGLAIFVDMVTKINGWSWLWVTMVWACSGGEADTTPTQPNTSTRQETEVSAEATPKLIFLGNSLTAGYGLELEQAFPHLIQQRIDSLGWPYEVVNAGISGETTAGGRDRIGWLLDNTDHPYLVVVALGGNDGLRAIDPDATYNNLQAILDTIQAHDPTIHRVVAGMEAPPNLGEDYTAAFRAVFPRLVDNNDITLMPFILQEVAGEPELNQADGIHPTAAGQQIIAENLWGYLEPLLKE